MGVHNHKADTAAAAWMTRHDAGLSASERAEFQAWLSADDANALAWAKVQAAWTTLDRPRRDGLAEAFSRELTNRQHRRKVRRYAFGTAGLAVAAALAVVFIQRANSTGEQSVLAATAPVLARPAQHVLSDGSVVDLNGNAEISVDYNDVRRNVRLLRGEAHFEVMKDAVRPFVVSAGNIEVRAVGTVFAVRLESAAVDVVVTEGRVAVERPSLPAAAAAPSAPAAVVISAGDRASVPTGPQAAPPQVEHLSPAEIARRLFWRGLRLELSGTTLADAIGALNEENHVHISIADTELARMRMSGVFRADDAEGFVDVLETSYDIIAERSGKTIVLRRRANR